MGGTKFPGQFENRIVKITWFDLKVSLPDRVLEVNNFWLHRARSDYGYVPLKEVKQRWQMIKRMIADDITDTSKFAGCPGRFINMHGPKPAHSKRFAIFTNHLRPIKDRPRRIELDQDSNDYNEWGGEAQPKQGKYYIE
jgi:hypothetical protein